MCVSGVNQAAAGYIDYEPGTQRYSLPSERAVALLSEQSPFYVGGALMIALAMTKAEPRIRENFLTGAGMGWGEHDRTCRRLRAPFPSRLSRQPRPELDSRT